jgi:hypothetical protein
MRTLWARAPQAVLAGVVHPFYRHQTVAWLAEELANASGVGHSASPGSAAAFAAAAAVKLATSAGCECRDASWSGVAGCRGGAGLHPWHAHSLRASDKEGGWSCDGRATKGGCRGNGGGKNQARYRCTDGCDYDLCQPCVDGGAFQARLDVVARLDEGGPRVPVAPGVHAVRSLLMDLCLRGLVLGPLRRALAPVREVGDALTGGGNFKWCAAAKVPDGRLFFLPHNATRSASTGAVAKLQPARQASGGGVKSPLLPPPAAHEDFFQVLVFDPHSGTSTLENYPLPHGFAKVGYNCAVVGNDGCVYGVPANGDRVLKIDPKKPARSSHNSGGSHNGSHGLSPALSFIGPSFAGDWKWGEGALASDGKIYCAPCRADQVLCIDPASGTVAKVGQLFEGLDKWWGAAWVPSGAAVAFHVGDQVLVQVIKDADGSRSWKKGTVVDVAEASIAVEDGSLVDLGTGAKGGGQDGPTYTVTVEATSSSYETTIAVTGAQLKQVPGVTTYAPLLTSVAGAVYFTPQNHTNVLMFDPRFPNDAKLVGTALSPKVQLLGGGEKFHGACCTSDGLVVCAPAHRGGRKALVFDPATQQVLLCGPDLGGEAYKWHGTVCGADGAAYGMPHNAAEVLAIDGSLAHCSALAVAAAEAEKDALGTDADATKTAELRNKITAAEGNGVVRRLKHSTDNALNNLLGLSGQSAGAARYGCGVLADDGFVYAAPFLATKILRINTAASIDTRRYSMVGSQKVYTQADDHEGTMLWLWQHRPELWFRALVHPTYGSEFLAWFAANSSVNAHDDHDDAEDDDHDGGGADDDAQTVPLAKQCGSGLRKASAAASGVADKSNTNLSSASSQLSVGAGSVLRPGEGRTMRCARRVAAVPGLLGALLDVADPLVRRRLLAVPFLRKVLTRSKTVRAKKNLIAYSPQAPLTSTYIHPFFFGPLPPSTSSFIDLRIYSFSIDLLSWSIDFFNNSSLIDLIIDY